MNSICAHYPILPSECNKKFDPSLALQPTDILQHYFDSDDNGKRNPGGTNHIATADNRLCLVKQNYLVVEP